VPTGADLATATIAGFSSGAGGYFAANFTTPLAITAGTRYAVIIRPVANPSAGIYAYVCSCTNGTTTVDSNPYINGQRVTSANSGVAWTADTIVGGRDFGFKIFVNAGFTANGNLISSVKDANPPAGASPVWTSLSWNASLPAGTNLRFQAAASNSPFGPFSFVGPDNTAATFFTTSGASLSQFNGLRYLRYNALLSTTSGAVTPAVNDVTVCYIDTLPTMLVVAPASGTYGGTTSLSATLTALGNPVGGKTISFIIDGNPAGSAVTDGSGVASLTGVPLGTLGAGSHTVGASLAGDSFYFAATGSNTLTIGQAVLTVTANNASRLYGTPNPTFTASYSGFQGGDTFASSVTGAPSLTTTATQFSAVGTYPITASIGTLASSNYSFTFVDGTLTIYLTGLVGVNSVKLGGFADSFDSTIGYPTSAGNNMTVLSNGTIEIMGAHVNGSLISTGSSILLQPGTIVNGNVVAGTTVTNKGIVNGTIAQNQSAAALVAPAVADCGAFTLNPNVTGSFTYSGGDLKVTGTASIGGGTYCFHSLTLNGGAVLQVSGAVSISLTGALNAGGGSFANSTHVPTNLQIASSYAGSNGVSLNGGAEAFLTVYAPKTDVTISGNSSLFGAVLGKTLTVSGNPDLHYDSTIGNIWTMFFGF
jgi:hypothetical protein